MMDKQKYYVSVGSGEILNDPTSSSYQFEIEATEADVIRLGRLFDQASSASGEGFLHIRAIEKEKNQPHDEAMSSIYQTLYDLGDDSTKQHIESMSILG